MSKELHINDNGVLRKASAIYVNDGGVLRPLAEGYINSADNLRQWWPEVPDEPTPDFGVIPDDQPFGIDFSQTETLIAISDLPNSGMRVFNDSGLYATWDGAIGSYLGDGVAPMTRYNLTDSNTASDQRAFKYNGGWVFIFVTPGEDRHFLLYSQTLDKDVTTQIDAGSPVRSISMEGDGDTGNTVITTGNQSAAMIWLGVNLTTMGVNGAGTNDVKGVRCVGAFNSNGRVAMAADGRCYVYDYSAHQLREFASIDDMATNFATRAVNLSYTDFNSSRRGSLMFTGPNTVHLVWNSDTHWKRAPLYVG